MENIKYNIKFRNETPNALLNIFITNGIITGSSILKSNTFNDIDVAVLCDISLIDAIDNYILEYVNADVETVAYIRNTKQCVKYDDAAQYVFNVLLSISYCIYIKNEYRDSTFISCYIRNDGKLYNLLLMDEENVFSEWKFATSCLLVQNTISDMSNKYERIKFFEKSRKLFRRTLR